MKLLETRFFRVPDEPRAWYAPIVWWELRRLPYNVIVFASALLNLSIFALTVDGWFIFISPPLLHALMLFTFSNIFYTSGWVLELALREIFKIKSDKPASGALFAGIVFSIFVTFIPALGAVIALVSGNKIVSDYAKFTKVRPSIVALVGEYELVEIGRRYLDDSSNSLRQPRIIIYADGIFEYFEIPWKESASPYYNDQQLSKYDSWRYHLPKFYFHIPEATFFSGEGVWELKQSSSFRASWYLSLSFEPPSNYPDTVEAAFSKRPSYRFDIQYEQSPHDLYYLMGDPDSMEGLIFRKSAKIP